MLDLFFYVSPFQVDTRYSQGEKGPEIKSCRRPRAQWKTPFRRPHLAIAPPPPPPPPRALSPFSMIVDSFTDVRGKAEARLRDIARTARISQNAGCCNVCNVRTFYNIRGIFQDGKRARTAAGIRNTQRQPSPSNSSSPLFQ